MTTEEKLRQVIASAQEVLEGFPGGGIGHNCFFIKEDIERAEAAGYVVDGDSAYHAALKAWFILEESKKIQQ